MKGEARLSEEHTTSVELMDPLRKGKSPPSTFQPMLEWHLKKVGHLKKWETLKDTSECDTRDTLMKKLSKRHNCEALKPRVFERSTTKID